MSSDGSFQKRSRDEVAIAEQMEESRVTSGAGSAEEKRPKKKYKVFSEDSSSNSDDNDSSEGNDRVNQPEAKMKRKDRERHEMDFQEDARATRNEPGETKLQVEKARNVKGSGEADTSEECVETKSTITRQVSKSTTCSEEKTELNESEKSLDFESNTVNAQCNENGEKEVDEEKAGKDIAGDHQGIVGARQELEATPSIEPNIEVAMDAPNGLCNFKEENVDRSSDGTQENLENESAKFGMKGDGQASCNIGENLEQNQDEQLECWFEKGHPDKTLLEIIRQSDPESKDLEKTIDDGGSNSRSESPAASLLTSGYGTIRSERQDGCHNVEDDRLTIHEFDKDSLYSFGVCEPEAGEIHGLARMDKLCEREILAEDEFWDGRQFEDGAEGDEEGRGEAQVCSEKAEGSDEDSSNKDIKFIDSKVDAAGTSHQRMLEEWEGNLRYPTGEY